MIINELDMRRNDLRENEVVLSLLLGGKGRDFWGIEKFLGGFFAGRGRKRAGRC